jgi:hypothetical protein
MAGCGVDRGRGRHMRCLEPRLTLVRALKGSRSRLLPLKLKEGADICLFYVRRIEAAQLQREFWKEATTERPAGASKQE